MSALKTRKRAIIFRLTDEEYDLLRDACRVSGGRNLSDFTRTGLFHHLETGSKPDRFTAIEQRLDTLHKDLQALRDSLARPA